MNIGTKFEQDFAAMTGGKLQPGSGNQFYAKMDVEHVGKFLFSLKATYRGSPNQSLDSLFNEVEYYATQQGSGVTPGVAVRINTGEANQRDIAMFNVPDLTYVLTEKITFRSENKGEARRRLSSVPHLLRED